ncbi:MAG: ribosomal L7Ae/L30e/S12e/Gadd45 family protein [Nanoarchaeota archaeon]
METSKEFIDKAFEVIEIAKNSGKIKKGVNEVTKVMEKGLAKLVVIAKDVNPPEVTMHIDPLGKEKGIPVVTVPSKEELGNTAGLQRPTAAVAVIQESTAKDLIKEIIKGLNK